MTGATTAETFDPAAIMGLRDPARRWLGQAIAAGTPLWSSVELTMHGQIKLGRWRPFTALNGPGPDVIRSAYGRLAGEIVLIPIACKPGSAASTPVQHPGCAFAGYAAILFTGQLVNNGGAEHRPGQRGPLSPVEVKLGPRAA